VIELSNIYKTLSPQSEAIDKAIQSIEDNWNMPGRVGIAENNYKEVATNLWDQGLNWVSKLKEDVKGIARGLWGVTTDKEFQYLLQAKILSRYAGLYLREGIRMQVRQGYSGNVGALKNRFTGKIIECNLGEQITIIGEGDGAELCNKIGWNPYEEPKMMGRGIDARNFLVGMMVHRGEPGRGDSSLADYMDIKTKGARSTVWGSSSTSPYGIYHFGSINYADSAFYDSMRGGFTTPQRWARKLSLPFDKTGAAAAAATATIGAVIGTALSFVEAPFLGARNLKVGTLEIEMNFYSPLSKDYVDGGDWLYYLEHLMSTDDNLISFQPAAAGHTFWSLSQMFADIASDYIRVAEPFEFRSTIFFGKPYWNYACEYMYPDSEAVLGRLIPPGYVTNVAKMGSFAAYQNNAAMQTYNNAIISGTTGEVSAAVMALTGVGVVFAAATAGISVLKQAVGEYEQIKHWGEDVQHYKASGEVTLPPSFFGSSPDTKISDKPTHIKASAIADPIALVGAKLFYSEMQPWQQMGIVYKPYQQLHVLSSHNDIIKNGIKASDKELYNVVTATTLQSFKNPNGYAQKQTVYADSDIFPENLKSITVNSGMVTKATLNFPILRWFMSTGFGSAGQTLAIGRARLRDYMKNMYQGVEVCIGNPSIKPYDLQYVADDRHGMYGLAGVRGIVDIMSFRDGYITVVEPDCCVYGTDRDNLKVWGWCTSFAKEEYGRRRVEQRQVEDYKMWRSAMGASVINELYGNASWRIPAQLAAAGIVAPYAAGFTEAASKYLFNFAVKSFVEKVTSISGAAAGSKNKTIAKFGNITERFKGINEAWHMSRTQYAAFTDPEAASAAESFFTEAQNFAVKYNMNLDQMLSDVQNDIPATNSGMDVSTMQSRLYDWDKLLDKFDAWNVAQTRVEFAMDYRKGKASMLVKYHGNEQFRNAVDAELKEQGIDDISNMDATAKAIVIEDTETGKAVIQNYMDVAADARGGITRETDQLINTMRSVRDSGQALQRISQIRAFGDIQWERVTSSQMGQKVAALLEGITPELRELISEELEAGLGLIEMGAVIIVMDTLTQLISNWAARRQAVTIMPLTVNGIELSAGIEGHRGCVVGDNLSFMDSLINRILDSRPASVLGLHAEQMDLSKLGSLITPPVGAGGTQSR